MATLAELQKTVKGLVMPIPAVLDGKGEPDLPMMAELTQWYLDTGVHGFFILGSQGQRPATTIEQRKAIVSRSCAASINGFPASFRSALSNLISASSSATMPERSAPTALASLDRTTIAIETNGRSSSISRPSQRSQHADPALQ